MTLTEDSIGNPIETINVSPTHIAEALASIDPDTKAFFILTETLSGSYLQCAGSKERLRVEMRLFSAEKFKHYVIGKLPAKNPFEIVWTQIDCRVGPIRIHTSELLTLADAIALFQGFLLHSKVDGKYNLRNVTKQYD
ncbi:hypothetical protein [Desertivirga brevis]|uniref:hypothetical protein n=1 Tax=Desertivirga brevis TaxID=2810310 RepID=UPI001A962303|nr:hypothetical protein [Pedobacter sp. SYSU D00873]